MFTILVWTESPCKLFTLLACTQTFTVCLTILTAVLSFHTACKPKDAHLDVQHQYFVTSQQQSRMSSDINFTGEPFFCSKYSFVILKLSRNYQFIEENLLVFMNIFSGSIVMSNQFKNNLLALATLCHEYQLK